MKLILSILMVLGVALNLSANVGLSVYEKVASLSKGLKGYIIGQQLNEEQKKVAKKNAIKKAVPGTYKFSDNEDKNLFIVVNSKNDRVLLIYKNYDKVSQIDLKHIISDYIGQYDEPTAMAHDKMIYWQYDKNGIKLTENDLQAYKDAIKGDSKNQTLADLVKNDKKETKKFEPYISIKLSSDQYMMSNEEFKKPANVYLIISSSKLLADFQR